MTSADSSGFPASNQSPKQQVAAHALARVLALEPEVLGIGSGSTVDCFIDALAASGFKPEVVAASLASEHRLRRHGFVVSDLNATGPLPLYVDGADQLNQHKVLIKGGGAALTREKILAEAAAEFICMAEQRKLVDFLGRDFPVAVEVIPMARSLIGRKLAALGAEPRWREGVVTDNGHWIIDAWHVPLADAVAMEQLINQWPGVVAHGLFALRRPEVVYLAGADGVSSL